MVGNPYTDMALEKDIYWKILRNQLVITGTWNSSFTGKNEDDWHYVLSMLAPKKISPAKLISHKIGFSELEQGLWIMKNRSEDYIKVMGIFDE